MKHIVSFSGGKDSTAMLLMMIERGMQIDEIICIDTTKEFPQMYEHIKTKGKNIGKKGYGFPDMRNRWCTALKRDAIKRVISKVSVQYHGIAVDEKHRSENNDNNIKYPLIEWDITEQQALEYCYSKDLNWGGLYEKFNRVSCWCCPLSRISELRVLYNEFPNLWQELREMDKKSFRQFRSDYSVDDLESKFKNENNQLKLAI